jgi:lambda family phage tail tape measure protein
MADNSLNLKVLLQGSTTGTEEFNRFSSTLSNVGKTADNVNKQMASLTSGVKALAAGFGVDRLTGFIAEMARATIQLDAYGKQLSIGFGGMNTAELDKLREIMRGLGIAQEQALGSAVRFTSALKLAGQTSSDANSNFEAASKLILSNKLSAEGAQRVYYAMSQIASKGKLYQEELSQQLGETLGGFTQQVAYAMGMSNAQLQKAMKDGKVTADQFFDALRKIGDGIDPSKLESSAQSLGKLQNAMFDVKTGILDTHTIKATLDDATGAMQFLAKHTQELATLLQAGLAIAVGKATQALYNKTRAAIEQSRVDAALAVGQEEVTKVTVASIAADYEKAQAQAAASQAAVEAAALQQEAAAADRERAVASLEAAQAAVRLYQVEVMEAAEAANSAEYKAQMAAVTERAAAAELELTNAIRLATVELATADAAVAEADAALATMVVEAEAAAVGLAAAGAAAEAAGIGVSLMSRAMSGLFSIVGGWQGLAFMGVALAVSYFTSRLSDAEQASRSLEAAEHDMGDYQLTLGKLLDERTGKHLVLTDALRQQYLAQMALNAAEAQKNLTDVRKSMASDLRNQNGGSLLDIMGQGYINQSVAETGQGQFVKYGASDAAEAYAKVIENPNSTPAQILAARTAARRAGVKGADDASSAPILSAANENERLRVSQKLYAQGPGSLTPEEQALAKSYNLPGFQQRTPITTPVADKPKHKADPYGTALKDEQAKAVSAQQELASFTKLGQAIEMTNRAKVEGEIASGKLGVVSDQQAKKLLAEADAADAATKEISQLKALNDLYTNDAADSAKYEFQLKHWDEFGGKIGKTHEALFQFNLEQGKFAALLADPKKAGLVAEAEAAAKKADADELAVKRKQEQADLDKAKIGWQRETEAIVDQMNAVSMTNDDYALLVERKQRLAQIEEEASKLSDEGKKKYREEAIAALDALQAVERLRMAWEKSAAGGAKKALHDYAEEAANTGKQIGDALTNAFKGAEDALVNFCMTGKLNFTDLANSIIKDLIRIAIQKAILGPLSSFLNSIIPGAGAAGGAGAGTVAPDFLMAAKGAAFDVGSVRKFATGDVFSQPTMFAYGGGNIGIMGEAGPEAIMPLKRGSDGKLGVASSGHGSTTNNVSVSVNVESGNTQIKSNSNQATDLGQAISRAVQAELVKQKRPGGLLAA